MWIGLVWRRFLFCFFFRVGGGNSKKAAGFSFPAAVLYRDVPSRVGDRQKDGSGSERSVNSIGEQQDDDEEEEGTV